MGKRFIRVAITDGNAFVRKKYPKGKDTDPQLNDAQFQRFAEEQTHKPFARS